MLSSERQEQRPRRVVIPFPKEPVPDTRNTKPMSPRAAEAFLLESVSAGSAVYIGTIERKGRRYQCYRIYNRGGTPESTVIYQSLS